MSRFLLIKLDYHSLIHFLGCAYITFVLAAIGLSHSLSFFGAVAAGLLWECADEINCEFALRIPFLDPLGFDVGDLIVDALGAGTALFMLWRIA